MFMKPERGCRLVCVSISNSSIVSLIIIRMCVIPEITGTIYCVVNYSHLRTSSPTSWLPIDVRKHSAS